MKILVCGGRDYDNRAYVFQVLEMIHEENPITCVVHGAATGADSLGQAWALSKEISEIPYPAEWDKFKRAAGPIRNAKMLRENEDIELVVAFPGGSGTGNMRIKAERAGIEVICL
jgi:hypothetical protein